MTATELLQKIQDTGLLYQHNLELDAEVVNFLSQPEPQAMIVEEDFETWWRQHHPFDWFAKECGSPMPAQYRLSIWAWAKDSITPLLDLSRKEKA